LVQQSQDEAQHIPSKHTISTSFTHWTGHYTDFSFPCEYHIMN
jgi:hypothetical protein